MLFRKLIISASELFISLVPIFTDAIMLVRYIFHGRYDSILPLSFFYRFLNANSHVTIEIFYRREMF